MTEHTPEADQREPLNLAFLATASRLYGIDGELEFDDNAQVSFGDDPGAYVQCWRWVTNEEVKKNMNAVENHRCMWCGRDYPDESEETMAECPSDDCPSNQES
jgi:hypothetical protein